LHRKNNEANLSQENADLKKQLKMQTRDHVMTMQAMENNSALLEDRHNDSAIASKDATSKWAKVNSRISIESLEGMGKGRKPDASIRHWVLELFLTGLDMAQIVPVVASSTWHLRADVDEMANELGRGAIRTVAYAARVIGMIWLGQNEEG